MRTLHVITGLYDGGAEAVLYRLATSDRAGHHVVVSLMADSKYGPLLRAAGVEVHCLNMPRGVVSPGGLIKLARLVRDMQPDVVQTWMYHGDLVGGVVAWLSGSRQIFWGLHNSTLEPGRSKRTTILVARLCALLSRWIPKRIVSPSQKAVEVHQALGYAADKFRIIPNGYDLTQSCPDPQSRSRLRAEWGIESDDLLLGTVARFDPQKDHANLFAALAKLKQRGFRYRCALVGSDTTDQNDQLVRLIEGMGLRNVVDLLGQRSDIPHVMNALDVLVLSSAYGEAFPNVLAEAMACGTPCVTTDVGDAAEIVGDTGWVVPPRDPDALAAALAAAIVAHRKTVDWQGRQRACRARIVDRYSIERMVEAYRDMWSSC